MRGGKRTDVAICFGIFTYLPEQKLYYVSNMMDLFKRPLFLLMLLIFPVQTSYAHENEDPELVSLIELLDQIRSVYVIDIRSNGEYTTGHIPTAINITLEELTKKRLEEKGITPQERLVIYDEDESQSRGAKAIVEAFGIDQIRVLAGGIRHWRSEKYYINKGN